MPLWLKGNSCDSGLCLLILCKEQEKLCNGGQFWQTTEDVTWPCQAIKTERCGQAPQRLRCECELLGERLQPTQHAESEKPHIFAVCGRCLHLRRRDRTILASYQWPAGTRIAEIYDEGGGELLILGEPGAGKTTLLLELCRELLSRAEQEPTHPIPVIFNLASLVPRKRQSLALWLLEELETKYYVPRSIGSDWISTNQILPLLDGLDEVDASSRPACIQAINAYHQTHSLVPLVVCCGLNDYRSEANRLELSRAVTIAPLTTEQITASLAQIGERIASLRSAFDHDPVLQELATTPLMLTILILAYQDSPLEEIKGGGSAEGRKAQIFATYTQRMLRRRKAETRYAPEQTIC